MENKMASVAIHAAKSEMKNPISEGNDQRTSPAFGFGGEEGNVVEIPGLGDLITQEKRGLKRPIEDEDDETMEEKAVADNSEKTDDWLSLVNSKKGGRRSIKKRREGAPAQQHKNPLMQLNEFKPGLEFNLTAQEGPAHAPTFVMSVTIDGQTFEGRGSSKQKAKHDVAERALRSFVQLPFLVEGRSPQPTATDMDFTADTAEPEVSNQGIFRTFSANGKNTGEETSQRFDQGQDSVDKGKHPVMLLNEMHQGQIEYQFLEEPSEQGEFVCTIVVKDQEFLGGGRSKKKAKAIAASKALLRVYGISVPDTGIAVPAGFPGNIIQPPPPSTQIPQHIADHIAQISLENYKELTTGIGEQVARRKVLAGVVMTTNTADGNLDYQMICIGTGTKFIGGEYISEKGYAVNDCHGEIIARRGLRRFLYSQLELCAEAKADSPIFEKKDSGLFGLKDGVDFHLYISTSPCGDARVFSPHEGEPGEMDRHAGRKKRGLLRVKLENGEGTIPVVNSDTSIQTWDGVLGTEKLRTMSCSDKICKWNLLGVQGALLSNYLEPIYLKSIILGSLYRYDHMARAMYQRLGALEGLPLLYKQHKPLMNAISYPETRVPGKAPKNSVNWAIADQKLENINALTGKLAEVAQPSRLCKQAMFSRFVSLWQKLKPTDPPPPSYHDAKHSATEYQTARTLMVNAFVNNGLGAWVKKPMEQDIFGLVATE